MASDPAFDGGFSVLGERHLKEHLTKQSRFAYNIGVTQFTHYTFKEVYPMKNTNAAKVYAFNEIDKMTITLCDGECVTFCVGNAIATLTYDRETETLYGEVTKEGKYVNGIEYNGIRYRSQLLDRVWWIVFHFLEE